MITTCFLFEHFYREPCNNPCFNPGTESLIILVLRIIKESLVEEDFLFLRGCRRQDQILQNNFLISLVTF